MPNYISDSNNKKTKVKLVKHWVRFGEYCNTHTWVCLLMTLLIGINGPLGYYWLESRPMWVWVYWVVSTVSALDFLVSTEVEKAKYCREHGSPGDMR